jgi:hypothetical protein
LRYSAQISTTFSKIKKFFFNLHSKQRENIVSIFFSDSISKCEEKRYENKYIFFFSISATENRVGCCGGVLDYAANQEAALSPTTAAQKCPGAIAFTGLTVNPANRTDFFDEKF